MSIYRFWINKIHLKRKKNNWVVKIICHCDTGHIVSLVWASPKSQILIIKLLPGGSKCTPSVSAYWCNQNPLYVLFLPQRSIVTITMKRASTVGIMKHVLNRSKLVGKTTNSLESLKVFFSIASFQFIASSCPSCTFWTVSFINWVSINFWSVWKAFTLNIYYEFIL